MTESDASYFIANEAKNERVRALRGAVLEIGAGDGDDLGAYGRDVSLTLLEPNTRRRNRLRHRLAGIGRHATVINARAESMPLPDASVDACVSSFVLCSVGDIEQALREIRRVLRPDGALIFAEHVAAEHGSWTHWLQRAANVVIRPFDGCNATRDTESHVREAGFALDDLQRFTVAAPLGARIPVIVGTATR